MSHPNATEWVTVAEASEMTGRPVVTLRRWAREGTVRAARSGGVWLVSRLDIEIVAESGEPPGRVATLAEDPTRTLRQAWSRVSRDLQRDDFPDIAEHVDFAARTEAEIETIVRRIRTGYEPGPIRMIEMPKTLLQSRPLAQLTIEDRLTYEASVQTLARSVDSRLHEHVYNHRVLSKPRTNRLVRHFASAYRDFEKYVTSQAWFDTGAQVCLITDIASFYEYVDHATLVAALDPAPDQVGAVDTLSRQLTGWRSQSSVIGIPQGPDASGILANAYLADIDSVCLAGSLAYARFSDDMRLFFAGEQEARRFAPKLVAALRGVGLNLSAVKTQIKTIAQVLEDDRGARRAAAAYNVELQKSLSLDELRAIFDDAIKDPLKVDGTDLTFSLWRLGAIEDSYPLEKILELFPYIAFKADIVADYLARLGHEPQVEEAIARYLTSPDNVHQWVEIQFIRLLGTFDHVKPPLLEWLRYLAFEKAGPAGDFAARALGNVGDPLDRKKLRQFAGRADVDPFRRRAATLGAGAQGEDDVSWTRGLCARGNPREVQRAAEYVARRHPLPSTLPVRRTPEWAGRLRQRLQAEGRISPRALDAA